MNELDVDDVVNTLERYANDQDNIDYASYRQIEMFTGDVVNITLGLIFVAIIMLFTLLTVADIAYLTLPTFRDIMQRKALDGSREGSKLKLVSNYARNSLEEADTVNTGESALGIYIRKRVVAWCIFVATVMIFLGLYSKLVSLVGRIAVEVYLKFTDSVGNSMDTITEYK